MAVSEGDLRNWLSRIPELLGNEGRLLLKLLHYDRIPWRKLDAIQSPAELYREIVTPSSLNSSSRTDELTRPISNAQFLSTMIHCLSILKGSDLGGQKCILALGDYNLPGSSTAALETRPEMEYPSRKAEFMEHLVVAYVYMKANQRRALLKHLGEKYLKLHADHASVDVVFSKLFESEKISTEEEPEVFISALKAAGAPQESFQAIISYLNKYRISHSDPQASIGLTSEMITVGETDEGDNSVQRGRPGGDEEDPLIPPRQRKKYIRRPCTYMWCTIFSIVAGILLYTTAALVFHFHYEPQQQTSSHEATCLNQKDDEIIAPVRVATMNAFEYYSVSVEQSTSGPDYPTLGVCFYLVPSNQITVRTQSYSYSRSGYEYFGRGWYCLEGSSLSFHICLSAKNNDPGSSNLTLFNSYNEYNSYINPTEKPPTHWMHYPLHVNGSETNCIYHNITVPRDMFVYYVIDLATNANLNFSITIERRHLNATDWKNVSPVCTKEKDNKEYTQSFSLFPPENSDNILIATAEYPGKYICNNAPAHVTLHYRGVPNKGMYIVLLIPIIGVSILFSIGFVIPYMYCKYKRNV